MTTQIRFTANKQMTAALKHLKTKLRFLSDAEIFKLAFSRLYNEEMALLDENGLNAQDRADLDEALAEETLPEVFDSAEDFIASLDS